MKALKNWIIRNIIILYFIVAISVLFIFIAALIWKANNAIKIKREFDNCYPLTTVVVAVSEANDTVTIKDFNGNLWQFHGTQTEDWLEGDICAVIFDGKGTEEIKDDEIVSVRYSGFVKNYITPAYISEGGF